MKGVVNKEFPAALPAMTVDTMQEAESLQLLTCKLAYDGPRYRIMSKSGFRDGDLRTLARAGDWLDEMYRNVVRKMLLTDQYWNCNGMMIGLPRYGCLICSENRHNAGSYCSPECVQSHQQKSHPELTQVPSKRESNG